MSIDLVSVPAKSSQYTDKTIALIDILPLRGKLANEASTGMLSLSYF